MKYIGIDIGGMTIGAGIVDDKEGILYKNECITGTHRSYDEITADIILLCKNLIKGSNISKADIKAVGIGVPGLETPDGQSYAQNLFWKGVPLAKDVKDALGYDVYIDNDASAAAMAEMGFGSLRGYKNALMLTLGTGIGGAIIIDGDIYNGSINAGGELGHFTFIYGGIYCTCGRNGCFEQYASAKALVSFAQKAAAKNKNSMLNNMASTLDELSAKDIVNCVRKNDKTATKVFEQYVDFLAQGIISFINIFNPEIVSIGGGLSQAGDILFDKVTAICKRDAFIDFHLSTKIVPAQLKNDAGILGAAMIANSRCDKKVTRKC